jgi:hypothetical protein
MRLERKDQLTLGALVKCIGVGIRKECWIGIVYNIDDEGVVYVCYDDMDFCYYRKDREVYNENIYLLREERAHEQ